MTWWTRVAGAIALGAAAAATAAAADEVGVTKDSIKIGITGPFTGSSSDFSKSQIGAIAYLRSINDAGGIHGRKLDLVVEDDGCDEAKGIAAVRKQIFDAKIFGFASGMVCSGVALAAKPVIVEAGVPWMVGTAASYDISHPVARNVFQPTATTVDTGHAMVRFAMSKPGVKTVAVISHSNEWAKGYYQGALAELKTAHKMDPVVDVTMERQSTNATPQILKLREANPDVILMILYPTESSIFLREARKYGLTQAIVTGYGTTIEDQLKRTGDMGAVKNLYGAYLLAHRVDAPAMKPWGDIIKKYYPQEELTAQNFTSLGGVTMFVKALEQIGPEPTREKLIAALDGMRDVDTGMMAGRFTFTPQDHAGQKELTFAGYRDGKVEVFTAWDKAAQ